MIGKDLVLCQSRKIEIDKWHLNVIDILEKIKLNCHSLMPDPNHLYSLNQFTLSPGIVILYQLMHFIVLLGYLVQSPFHIYDLLLQTIQNHLLYITDCPHFILNVRLDLLYSLSDLLVALINWENLMEFMLVLPKDAICAE